MLAKNETSHRLLTSVAALLLLALNACAFAAPQITAVTASEGYVHGRTLTIAGRDFGNKSPARPYLWADFNHGSLQPSALGLQTAWTGIENMVHHPTEGVGGTGVARSANASGTWTLRIDAANFAWNDPSQKMYLYRKTKRNFDIGSTNWKTWRLWSENFSAPDMYLGSNNGIIMVEGIENSGGWLRGNATAWQGPTNAWFIDEIILRSNSSLTSSDGEVSYFLNGVEYGHIPYSDYRQWVLKMKQASSQRMTINFPVHGVKANATFPSSYAYWADDVYLDTTWARVMIGNAPTWSASTQKEIQIPTAWSSSLISVVLNVGAFNNITDGYLYVVDSNGNVNSNGYPLCTGCPKSPSNLR